MPKHWEDYLLDLVRSFGAEHKDYVDRHTAGNMWELLW